MNKKLSRRDFLKSTAVGAVTVVASGLLTGCKAEESVSFPEETTSTTETPKSNEQTTENWLGTAPEIKESDVAETINVGLLCVGAGMGGLFTAASALENGVENVVVIEQHDGTSKFRTDVGGVDSRLQKELNVQVDRFRLFNEINYYATGQVDNRALNVWMNESGEAVDWMLDLFDEYGVEYFLEWDTGDPNNFYHSFPITHGLSNATQAMEALLDRVDKDGGTVSFGMTMLSLIREGDRITGVYAQDQDGRIIRFLSEKGVVLATGGYANNDEMLSQRNPYVMEQCTMKEKVDGVNGDGIKAGLWAGADMDQDPVVSIFERGAFPFDAAFEGPSDKASIWWPGSQPFLRVNSKGLRYSNEATPYEFALFAARAQHESTWIQIFDANWQEQIAAFRTVGCSRIVEVEGGGKPELPMVAIEAMMGSYLESGLIQSADTIEELAEKIGIEPSVLRATIDHYNELCDNEEDTDFYKESYRMLRLDTAPFYAVRLGGMLLNTYDGLRINEDMQVLDKDGQVIQGLYATGNDAGGTFARSYPSKCPGLTAGRNITFARHIGRFVASQG